MCEAAEYFLYMTAQCECVKVWRPSVVTSNTDYTYASVLFCWASLGPKKFIFKSIERKKNMILCGVKYSLSVDALCLCKYIYLHFYICKSKWASVYESENRRAPRTITCFDNVYSNPGDSSTVFCLFYSTLPGALVHGLSCFRFIWFKQFLSVYQKVNPWLTALFWPQSQQCRRIFTLMQVCDRQRLGYSSTWLLSKISLVCCARCLR